MELETKLITEALTCWFTANKRPIIFRELTDPYHILVSELMLQQTTVATATPFFHRFIERFPTVSLLASASDEEVMTLWAGLGYYRRARLLHKAAQQIVQNHHSTVPRDLHDLMALPGIGRYTAGAVLSFGYNIAAPIVEANTLRVYARLQGICGLVTTGAVQKEVWALADRLVHAATVPGLFNHAIMEHGAVTCQPVPKCPECVIRQYCIAYSDGKTQSIPTLPAKLAKRDLVYVCFVVNAGARFLVRRIPEGEWHAGLFSFPTFPLTSHETLVDLLRDRLHFDNKPGDLSVWSEFRYTVTTNRITLKVYKLSLPTKQSLSDSHLSWNTLAQLRTLPLGSAQKKILNLLISRDDLISDLI